MLSMYLNSRASRAAIAFFITVVFYFAYRSSKTFITLIATDVIEPSSHEHENNFLERWPALRHLRTSTTAVAQSSTVTAMIARLLGKQRARYFTVTVNASLIEQGRDVFVIDDDSDGASIHITGSTGVAAAMGFQYYAKTFGGCHFSWSGNQVATLTSPPPPLPSPIKVVANDLFRYYQNVCAAGYSSVWWNWTRWEQEIDWMALNGINLPLAFTGQEAIWRRVYRELGFTQKDLDAFFSGPAFLPWNRMGNQNGWGGPLPEEYYEGQLKLQHRILDRMRNFGMIPVLPAFSGNVPSTIKNHFPNAEVSYPNTWHNFSSIYRTTLLGPGNFLFRKIGKNFIREMTDEFGVNHIYSCDAFNEMNPPADDPTFISDVGRAIFDAMVVADPKAILLMQSWLFLDDYWNVTRAEALLRSVPLGRLIVLDLQAELTPQYQRMNSFFGQPWIWCMLHNFGGVKGLYGTVDGVNQGPFLGRTYADSTMIGTGLTPEGIDQNDVMYELMNEMAYRKAPVDLDVWFTNFAFRRYGESNSDVSFAWRVMARTVFNCTSLSFHGNYIITMRPGWNLSSDICYNVSSFLPAWSSFVTAAEVATVATSDLFQHDLVDVTREALVVIATHLYQRMSEAFAAKDSASFRDKSDQFLDLLTDLDILLASDRRFLLGPWLASAKSLASNETNARLYEYNARNQITLWGPTGQIVDYASKQWSGMISDYYLPRWKLFAKRVQLSLNSKKPFNPDLFDKIVFRDVESPFTFDTISYPVHPDGDSVRLAMKLYSKWCSHYPDVLKRNIEGYRCVKANYFVEA